VPGSPQVVGRQIFKRCLEGGNGLSAAPIANGLCVPGAVTMTFFVGVTIFFALVCVTSNLSHILRSVAADDPFVQVFKDHPTR